MMLRHLEQNSVADNIEQALFATLAQQELVTGDLGGKNSCSGFTKEVISRLQ
jgi:isocitrate dehydrogenase (NAD+)